MREQRCAHWRGALGAREAYVRERARRGGTILGKVQSSGGASSQNCPEEMKEPDEARPMPAPPPPPAKKMGTSSHQTFRFSGSKSESLFLQRKNPRKIAWTQVYRRMHKKGITEEVAKKRSRKNVKVQRGVVGADLASILAKRTAKPEVRQAARQAAITKAKAAKKEKETKKASRPQVAGHAKVSKQAAKGHGLNVRR